ncbi:MAG: hypothetical protein NC121_07945 [Blautia sp.]|nr:hypothetical protein [Blautia sp.]
MQSKIDRKNEEIDILKIGLSGIAKRYGYQSVQEFYKIYHQSQSAYAAYREQEAEWIKLYGMDNHKQDKESIHKLLQNHKKEKADRHIKQITINTDRRTR